MRFLARAGRAGYINPRASFPSSSGSTAIVMTKFWGPSWGKQLPGERLRETAETRHTSPQPSRRVRRKGAAPLSGAEEQNADAISAYAQYNFLLSLQLRSIH
jgi:hypothetical protein